MLRAGAEAIAAYYDLQSARSNRMM